MPALAHFASCPVRRYFAALLLPCALLAGCATSKSSNTSRTALEQMLISNAIDQALDKVNFSAFNGQSVYVSEKYVDCVDKNYLIASVRHRILRAGGRLVDDAASADLAVELRSGGVGTDSSESFVGIPEITLPGMMTLPEIRLLTRKTQTGTAKIGMVAYDTQTRAALQGGGVSLAQSVDNNWFVAGTGPFNQGTIKSELHRGTTGANQSLPPQIPPKIAFSRPGEAAGEPRIQYASGPPDVPPVKQ